MSLTDKLRIFEQAVGVYKQECSLDRGRKLNAKGMRQYKDMKNGPCKEAWDYNFCDGTTDPYKLIVAQRKFQGCADARKAFMDDCIATPDQGHLFAQRKMQKYADVCQNKLDALLNKSCSTDSDCGGTGLCFDGECYFESRSYAV